MDTDPDSLPEFSDSADSEDELEQDKEIMTAEAPRVFEQSVPIQTIQGLPFQLRHCGYRICGDNIDKMIRRRHLRSDRENISLHYFHSFAAENRVNFSEFSDIRPDNSGITYLNNVALSIQPTESDDLALRKHFAVIVSRILCKKMSFFKTCFDDIIEWHIQHRYSKEMNQKSVVVSDMKNIGERAKRTRHSQVLSIHSRYI